MDPTAGDLATRINAATRVSVLSRLRWLFGFSLVGLTQIPVVSAHDITGSHGLTQTHGLLVVGLGIVVLGVTVWAKRTNRSSVSTSLSGILLSLGIVAIGAILFDGLAPDPTFTAQSMPFPRSFYPIIALSLGLLISIGSFLGGLRWFPARPRYPILGSLIGLWVAYPALLGDAGATNPIGYLLVVSTPLLIGYILWKDAGWIIQDALSDRVARQFGIGVSVIAVVFLLAMAGYLSVFWEQGVPRQSKVVVLPVVYLLVQWPTLEVLLPQIPLVLALSPGILIVVGSLSLLIGLNGSLIARQWRLEEQAGLTEGTVGSGAVLGSCTCGCCGPFVAKVALLAIGPSAAAPLYWVFVDSASPVSSLFIIGSLVIFTASLVYTAEQSRPFAGPGPRSQSG